MISHAIGHKLVYWPIWNIEFCCECRNQIKYCCFLQITLELNLGSVQLASMSIFFALFTYPFGFMSTLTHALFVVKRIMLVVRSTIVVLHIKARFYMINRSKATKQQNRDAS